VPEFDALTASFGGDGRDQSHRRVGDLEHAMNTMQAAGGITSAHSYMPSCRESGESVGLTERTLETQGAHHPKIQKLSKPGAPGSGARLM
jgi:hypothetical protein